MSLKILFVALMSACLSGCQDIVDIFSPSDKSDQSIEAEAMAVWDDGQPRIRLGVGLIIHVGVSGQKPCEMSVMVDQNGDAILPYLITDPVKCDGLTLDAFRQKLVKLYQEFIKQPQVMVRFAPITGPEMVSPYGTVLVLGQVSSPGPVNLPPTMDFSVTKAIKAAGGLRQFANKRKVQVTRRERDGSLVKTFVDLEEIGEKGRIEKDMRLRSGDVVYAHESWY